MPVIRLAACIPNPKFADVSKRQFQEKVGVLRTDVEYPRALLCTC